MAASNSRALLIAAGFLGVSIVVAGTANAMAGAPRDAAVGTAVEVPRAAPLPESVEITEPAAPKTPAASTPTSSPSPTEVGPGPIECSDEGSCSSRKKPGKSAGAGEADARKKPAQVEACAWPEGPPPGWAGERSEIDRDTFHAWKEEWRAAAKECGWNKRDEHWQEMERRVDAFEKQATFRDDLPPRPPSHGGSGGAGGPGSRDHDEWRDAHAAWREAHESWRENRSAWGGAHRHHVRERVTDLRDR